MEKWETVLLPTEGEARVQTAVGNNTLIPRAKPEVLICSRFPTFPSWKIELYYDQKIVTNVKHNEIFFDAYNNKILQNSG